ncbi:MAG: reverse transcriptase family protein, partial [Providencia heimbachae]|nr:reverse transcriptase family protein [Providencia heimbachae]
DARRRRRQVAIAWLDLRNAFGSISHTTIFYTLRWLGLHEDSINVVRNLYNDCCTTIRSADTCTDNIPIKAGVKQGCPLSPIIFNMALEPLIRAISESGLGYTMGNGKFNILAYADDIAIIADSADDLQKLLNIVASVAEWLGIQFNPSKCATLHVDGRSHTSKNTTFELNDQPLTALKNDEFYEHLGVPTGFNICSSPDDVVTKMLNQIKTIDSSLLAPWQKFDALKTFIVPQIEFQLKTSSVTKSSLTKYDKIVKRHAKKWANLPQRASPEILYIENQHGGFGLLPLNILADAAHVIHAFRLLTSPDQKIVDTVKFSLEEVVKKRIRRTPVQKEIDDYLNSSFDAPLDQPSNDICSIWSRVRTAMRRLKKTIHVEFKEDTIIVDNTVTERKNLESALRQAIRKSFLNKLLQKPDQGKVFEVTASNSASNHFLRAGNYTRFAEWRFIHRARLNTLPLNGSRHFGN